MNYLILNDMLSDETYGFRPVVFNNNLSKTLFGQMDYNTKPEKLHSCRVFHLKAAFDIANLPITLKNVRKSGGSIKTISFSRIVSRPS